MIKIYFPTDNSKDLLPKSLNITNMSYMFYKCNSLISLPNLSKWNTENVKDMTAMFCECNSLIDLPDISN